MPGLAAERGDLDPTVLAGDPVVGVGQRPPVPRLDPRVVEKRPSVLDGLVFGIEQRDLPVRERPPELAELVLVPRGEDELQAAGAAAASRCAAVSCSMPPPARSRSSSRSSRENGSRSAVAWTSTSSASPVMTTFMSVSALESSS